MVLLVFPHLGGVPDVHPDKVGAQGSGWRSSA